MKRTRANLKKYVESSESEDDRPLKKPSPNRDEPTKNEDSSSSESDIERYLHKPEKLDLDSEFFNAKSTEFEKIEKNIFADVKRLSDSDSDVDNEAENQLSQTSPTKPPPTETLQKEPLPSTSKLTFSRLQDYTNQIEEARRQVEIYKAKKRARENPTDILNLLSAGERKLGLEHNLTPADLHSSDFESCDSEREDWEEIKNLSQMPQEKPLVPTQGLQIVVDMPDNVRKKKGVDLVAAMKRRLNRIRKENQLLVHKVHLLCWIAHGNYVNSIINETEILALALSMLPSEKSYPADRIDLGYLEQIVLWFSKSIIIVEKPVPDDLPLEKCLENQITRKEAYNKKMLAIIFVAILRSLGVQARLVMSLQVEPLRPPASELHSLSTKNDKKAVQAKTISNPKSKASTSGTNGKKADVKIKVQKPTPEKQIDADNKLKTLKNKTVSEKCEKKEHSESATSNIRLKSKKQQDDLKAGNKNKQSEIPKKKEKTKSSDSTTILKSKKEQTDLKTKQSTTESSELNVVKPKRRARSAESTNDTEIESQKDLKKKDNPKETRSKRLVKSSESLSDPGKKANNIKIKLKPKQNSKTASDLKPADQKKRSKSADVADSTQKTKKSDSTLKVPKTRKRTNSSESVESRSSIDSNKPKSTKRTTRSKAISQVDGIFDTDSETEVFIPQLDGSNDKSAKKPNLKALKKEPVPAKKPNTRPNLRALSVRKILTETTESDSESEFEPSSDVSFEKRLERSRMELKKLKRGKPNNVKNDIIKIVKTRISQQKEMEWSKLVKSPRKRKPMPESDSDSDYAPEPVKKKHQNSEDEFCQKTKVKRRVQVRPSDEEKKKKIGTDIWVEVFLEAEEKWISVDVVLARVHCIKELAQRATHPISYVLSWDNNNNIKDVTKRYCPNFNTVTRKLRINQKWWDESLKPFQALPTARDKEEDDDLARQQLDQPIPKTISEYKDHPLYALKRHLLKFEAIYPPEPPTLGFIRGEAVYPRGCVFTLHSREIWLKQAKVVKLGEQPYKIVKARPKWDKLSNKVITDQELEIFGPWQVQDYDPPTAENGVVPKNAFGNVDLFKPCMLPKGCAHLKLPGLNKIARRMNIDCASAIVGFDFHGGWSHPIYDGFVVCQEYEDQLIFAWEVEQDELEKKEQEKLDKRVYGNWKKLIRGLLIRERLKAKYDFGKEASAAVEADKCKKKAKGPTFCIKKK